MNRKESQVEEGVKSLPVNKYSDGILNTSGSEADIGMSKFCEFCEGEKHMAVLYCAECGQGMCEVIARVHEKSRATKHHTLLPAGMLEQARSSHTSICSEHDEAYRYFDNNCKCLICVDCFVLNHSSHKCQTLREAAPSCRKEVQSMCDNARRLAQNLDTSEKKAAGELQSLDQNYKEVKKQLEEEFDKVCEILAAKKKELSSELEEIYNSKSSVLHDQIEQNKSLNSKLSKAVSQVAIASQGEKDFPLLLALSDLKKTLVDSKALVCSRKEIIEQSMKLSLKLLTNSPGLVSKINEFGIIDNKWNGVWSYKARGPGLMFFMDGYATNGFSIFGESFPSSKEGYFNKPTCLPSEETLLKVNVQAKGGVKSPGSVKYMNERTFLASYRGQGSKLKVSVEFDGAHIEGSPFDVPQFLEKVEHGTKTRPEQSFKNFESTRFSPSDPIEFLVSGEIYESDTVAIIFLDQRGPLLKWEQKNGYRSTNKFEVECVVDASICTIEGQQGRWQGYVKLGASIVGGSGQLFLKLGRKTK